MAIVKIKKELKSNVNSSNTYNRNDVLPGVSLTSLNNSNDDYKFDFGNNSAGMSNGVLKNEVNVLPACVRTVIRSLIKIAIFLGIIYLILKYAKLDIDLTMFEGEGFLTQSAYDNEFLKVCLIIGCSLFVSCLMIKFFINGSVKKTFKKHYLSRFNTYIYDGFVVVYNVVIYIIVCVLYFMLINNVYDRMEVLEEAGNLVDGANIELFNLLKYGAVIIIAIFATLNALRGVSLIHKKNKFVFDETL